MPPRLPPQSSMRPFSARAFLDCSPPTLCRNPKGICLMCYMGLATAGTTRRLSTTHTTTKVSTSTSQIRTRARVQSTLPPTVPSSIAPQASHQREAYSVASSAADVAHLLDSERPRFPLNEQLAPSTGDPRADLANVLQTLEADAAFLTNPVQLRLARASLRAPPGREPVRIAVLALRDSDNAIGHDDIHRNEHHGPATDSPATAATKRLLHALLADPLSAAPAAWERELSAHCFATDGPLIVRFRPRRDSGTFDSREGDVDAAPRFEFQSPLALCEITVDHAFWNDHDIEMLVTEHDGFAGVDATGFSERALVPNVYVGAAVGGKVATAVHRTVVVGAGFKGAAQVAALPLAAAGGRVVGVADVAGMVQPATASDNKQAAMAELHVVDLALAEQGISLFRESAANAIRFEHMWFDSNLPSVRDAMLRGAHHRDDFTKPVVNELVTGIVRETSARLEVNRERQATQAASAAAITQASDAQLEAAVAEWSEMAHTELQKMFTDVFRTHRWHRLYWWRLFWRVDDVPMIAADLVTRFFLVDAEKRLIYLSGRIAQARLNEGLSCPAYPSPVPFSGEQPDVADVDTQGLTATSAASVAAVALPTMTSKSQINTSSAVPSDHTSYYPTHIAHTRRYIEHHSISALTATAQRVVAQAATTTLATSGLGFLLWISDAVSTILTFPTNFPVPTTTTITPTISATTDVVAAVDMAANYSASSTTTALAVALLGATWAAWRAQGRWIGARKFWEAQLREEARKVVVASEAAALAAVRRHNVNFGMGTSVRSGSRSAAGTGVGESMEDVIATAAEAERDARKIGVVLERATTLLGLSRT